jgi:subfamily B ATP-binding cassette protein MsbA
MASQRLSPRKAVGFLRRLVPRVRPYRGQLLVALVLLVVSTAVGLVFPLVVRQLLDAAFLAANGARLNQVAVGLLVLFAFQAVINFGQSYLMAGVSERVIADLRKDLFGHLALQPPGFFSMRRVGELSSRIAADPTMIQQVLRFGVPELMRQGLFLIGALTLVTLTNPRLTLVTLTAIPFAILVGWFFGRRVRKVSTSIQDTLAVAIARAEQVFTQIRVVQSFTREAWEAERFAVEIDKTRDLGLKRGVERASLTGVVTFTAFGAVVLVLWEGGRLVLAGALTPGTLVAFLLYAVTISGAIMSMAGFWSQLQESAGAAQRIFELLDHPHELIEHVNARPLSDPVRGVVRYEGVWFRYAQDQPWVLAGIDADIEEGSTVALVGSSGAGKSTLASLLPRFFDAHKGRVSVDGIDVREVRLEELRRAIGIVPQEPMLFAGSVRENLLYGNADAAETEMVEAARAAHAHDFISGFTRGYDELVGERGVTLSAGQRQRIAIARVMLKRPRLLILDEASSSLDAESERLVQDALERLMSRCTTMVIAHRLSTVIRADRILVLEGGSIVDRGTHSELLGRSEVYGRLYRSQFDDAMASVEPVSAVGVTSGTG